MSAFRLAHASAENWGRAAKSCVDQLGSADGATLGFVYVTDRLSADLDGILTVLREMTGVPHWIGTVGLGVVATGREYFDEPAMAVMVGNLPPDSFRIFPTVAKKAGELRAATADWKAGADATFGIVHGDPRHPSSPELLAAVAKEAGIFFVGGLSSSRGGLAQVADKLTDGGLSGVLFSGTVPVATGLTQGCSPVGPVRRVTACQENVLTQIDEISALDALMQDVGADSVEELARRAVNIHVALPVSGSDTGDYMVRNLVGIDPDKGLVAIGERVAPGDRIMFCRRDKDAAREDLSRMLKALKRRAGGVPKAGVYYTCVARGPNLFGPGSAELTAIRDELGDFPLVGFFCNGEISNDRLYGYTGVLALFL